LLIEEYLAMAQQALATARAAAELSSNDPAELQRFVSDSECLVLTVEFYRLKVLAARAKRLFELTGDAKHAEELRANMIASVPAYESMMRKAQQHYRAGSSMWDAKPWQRCLDEKVIPDRDRQLAWLKEKGR
jgi:hypothetical protein